MEMNCRKRFYADIISLNPEVTGSCNLVIIKLPNKKTIRFVVDCGIYQEKEYEELNKKMLFDSKEVDFVLITHNHVDHIGRLPLMVKNGFNGNIYTTFETSNLMELSLRDTNKILEGRARLKNKKCLFNNNDVEKTLTLIWPCEYEKTIAINENVKATFFVNGHLVGAALILVQITYPGCEDINILFTGDYNNKNVFFDVPNLPKWVLELPLTIVQEATYGTTESSEIKASFKNNIKKCLDNNGNVLILAFALGRMQEILYNIKEMQDDNQIKKEIPIFVDGNLAIEYTKKYINNQVGIREEMRNFLPQNLTVITKADREIILRNKKRKILITTSGMGSNGPAQMYIPEYISRPNTLIQFTGYTAEGTLGRKLQNVKDGEYTNIGGVLFKKRAVIKYTEQFSSHAKADEMIDFLNKFANIRLVLLNHGNKDVKEIFASRVEREVKPRLVGILGENYIFRVNHFGFVKSIDVNAKFEKFD